MSTLSSLSWNQLFESTLSASSRPTKVNDNKNIYFDNIRLKACCSGNQCKEYDSSDRNWPPNYARSILAGGNFIFHPGIWPCQCLTILVLFVLLLLVRPQLYTNTHCVELHGLLQSDPNLSYMAVVHVSSTVSLNYVCVSCNFADGQSRCQ